MKLSSSVMWDRVNEAIALSQVKEGRPLASPNVGFICNLLEWHKYRNHQVSDR
jgi:hypothetical protein